MKNTGIIFFVIFSISVFMGTACEKMDPDMVPVIEALHYLRGDNPKIPQDTAKGAEMLRNLADQGNAIAAHELGMCYQNGVGVMRNHAATMKYLTQAADRNYPPALYELAILYLDGKITEKDEGKGFQLLSKAAESHYKQAYIYMIYLADQGNPRAQYIYAGWLTNGVQGICEADPDEALKYYQDSAKQGYALSSAAYLEMLPQKLKKDFDRFAIKLFATTASANLPLSDDVELELVKVQGGVLKKGEEKLLILTQSFAIGKYEVTQKQFEAVMGYNPSWFKGKDNPVEKVDWREAEKFCEKLTEKFADQLPEGYRFSLPTSAQWEFAACGGVKSSGFVYSGSNDPDEVAWYTGNADKQTHPVGMKKENELGLCDMSGNVWEWCRDGFVRGSNAANINPEAPESLDNRVYRGGSWCNADRFSRCDNFNYFAKNNRFSYLGFRVAMIPTDRDIVNQVLPEVKEHKE